MDEELTELLSTPTINRIFAPFTTPINKQEYLKRAHAIAKDLKPRVFL